MTNLEFEPKLTYFKIHAPRRSAHNFLSCLTDGYGVMERALCLKVNCVLVLVLPLMSVPWASHLTFLGLSSLIHNMEPVVSLVELL